MPQFSLFVLAPEEYAEETFSTDVAIWTETDDSKTVASRHTDETYPRDSVMKFIGNSWTFGDGIKFGDGYYFGDSDDGKGEGVYKDFIVTPGILVVFSCLFKIVEAGTLTIILYDQTNGKNITTIDKSDPDWSLYDTKITAPANCETLRVKFLQKSTLRRRGPFLIDNINLNSSPIETDPDVYNRIPQVVGSYHQTLSGRKVFDLTAIHYRLALGWNSFGKDIFDKFQALYYSGRKLYFDDGEVPEALATDIVYDTEEINFAGITNPSSTHKAYTDSSSSLPSAKVDFETTEISTAAYQAIDGDDSNYLETTNPDADKYLYHKYMFLSSIASANVQRLRIKVALSGNDSSPQNIDGGVLYIWNGTGWVEIGRVSSSAKSEINYSITDENIAQTLVDSGDNYIRLLLRSRNRRNGTNDLSLRTYYPECEINEGLDLVIELSHKAILDANDDVISVRNVTKGTLLTDDYTIASNRESVTILIDRVYAKLDGDSQYFYRTDADFPESGITGDFTIQGWINPNNTVRQPLADKWGASGNRMWRFHIFGGELILRVSPPGGVANPGRSSTNADIVTDKWAHVAVTYDVSEKIAIFYKNGVALEEDGDTMQTGIHDGDPDFRIGIDADGYYFGGGLYNFALFNDIRTPEEIAASAADREQDLSGAGNIIAQWMFDEAGAASAIDNTETDAGRDLIPYDGGDVTFANCGRYTVGESGDEFEVTHNRYFEVMFADLPEEWLSGDPASGDRKRSAEIILETVSGTKY